MLVGAIRKKIAGCGDVDAEPRMLVIVVGDPNTYRGSSSFAGSIWKGKILWRGVTICVGISSTTEKAAEEDRCLGTDRAFAWRDEGVRHPVPRTLFEGGAIWPVGDYSFELLGLAQDKTSQEKASIITGFKLPC
jgi:hypothetical protein